MDLRLIYREEKVVWTAWKISLDKSEELQMEILRPISYEWRDTGRQMSWG